MTKLYTNGIESHLVCNVVWANIDIDSYYKDVCVYLGMVWPSCQGGFIQFQRFLYIWRDIEMYNIALR